MEIALGFGIGMLVGDGICFSGGIVCGEDLDVSDSSMHDVHWLDSSRIAWPAGGMMSLTRRRSRHIW